MLLFKPTHILQKTYKEIQQTRSCAKQDSRNKEQEIKLSTIIKKNDSAF